MPPHCLTRIAVVVMAIAVASPASAGDADWEISEVLLSDGGDTAVRFVEIRNLPGGCLAPTSKLEVYDAAGNALDAVSAVTLATCFSGPTYFVFATSDAAARFGITADRVITPTLPSGGGQVCIATTNQRLDCVRWGNVTASVVDFFGPADETTATTPPDGASLSRVDTTNVVENDWAILQPTPRGPNDGSPWSPPDAGPSPDAAVMPDAAALVDANPADAAVRVDARSRADASSQRFLDLNPVGGASCDCRSGLGGGGVLLLFAVLAGVVVRRRSQRYVRC